MESCSIPGKEQRSLLSVAGGRDAEKEGTLQEKRAQPDFPAMSDAGTQLKGPKIRM